MTTRKHLKRRIRARAAQTGLSYSTALRNIRREQEENQMSASTNPTENVIASCSFCGKSSTQVDRIVAGPGVYICNECVELSTMVLAEAAKTRDEGSPPRNHVDLSAEEILSLLPALNRSSARIEAELAGWVHRLKAQHTDWPTIANALGVSVEEARQRFSSGATA